MSPWKLIRRNTGRPLWGEWSPEVASSGSVAPSRGCLDVEGSCGDDDPLQYVVNASVPVLRVDAPTYYSLQNGVWLVDTATTSPPC